VSARAAQQSNSVLAVGDRGSMFDRRATCVETVNMASRIACGPEGRLDVLDITRAIGRENIRASPKSRGLSVPE